jgi:hypothetical protein
MSKSRLLRSALAFGIVSLLGACAVAPPYEGPPYEGPPYEGQPPVVIVDPCHNYVFGCDRGPDHGRPPGPDRGHPDPDHGGHSPDRDGHGPDRDGHGPDHGPGQARPPAPRPQPPAPPRPGRHDEEEQPVKH